MPLRGVITTLVRGWKPLKAAACRHGGRRPWSSGLRSYSQYGCRRPQEEEEEVLIPTTAEWYRAAYPRLIKLACALKNVDQVDGRITDVDGGLVITDGRVISDMQTFKWLARALVGSASMDKTGASAPPARTRGGPTTLGSLTTVCNLLNISAQQSKSIRLAVCPQVTQHRVWRAALEQVLEDAGSELRAMPVRSPAIRMAEQIVSSCLQFLADTAGPPETTPVWMQFAPTPERRAAHKPAARARSRWAEVLGMFEDLSRCLLAEEEELAAAAGGGALGKIGVMMEGLYQIKDLLVERRDLEHKEARRQDCLVKKNLSKNLGHSSRCLFTLLRHYLFGTVGDVEVDVYRFSATAGDGRRHLLVAGKILTSDDDERMLRCGLKQVDGALRVSKFVWEAAGMKGALELQGHIWVVGAKERGFTYRGNRVFVHDLRLR